MSIKLQELSSDTTIVKHYIKDLSFENLCDVNNQDFKKDEVKISDNIRVVFNLTMMITLVFYLNIHVIVYL